jgi:CTP synthase
MLICRTEWPLAEDIRRKVARFCNVDMRHVIESRDLDTIYEVPLRYHEQGLDGSIVELLGLETPEPDLADWEALVDRIKHPSGGTVRIAVVGKYTSFVDSYKSIQESLIHGGIAHDTGVDIDWLSSEAFEEGGAEALARYHGVLIPGGFGGRGIAGMVDAVRPVRESGIPFFGICLGLQCAIIEFARNACGLEGADSAEFAPESPHRVISLLDSQLKVTDKGGTMRLGAYPAHLADGTRVREIYGEGDISERHRHRFEVNNEYRDTLAEAGLVFSGTSPDGGLVEIIELPGHPFFVATQFHPELKSRPNRPHPLFAAFVGAAIARRDGRQDDSAARSSSGGTSRTNPDDARAGRRTAVQQ